MLDSTERENVMAKWSAVAPAGLGGIGRFLEKDERHALVSNPVRLLRVVEDNANRFGARWVLGLAYVASAEKVALGIKKNSFRDMQMDAARTALTDGETFDPVIIEQRPEDEAYVIRDATDVELDAVVAAAGADSLADLLAVEPWSEDDDAGETEGDAAPTPEPEPIPGEKLRKARK